MPPDHTHPDPDLEAKALDSADAWRTRAEAAEQELAVRDDAITTLEADLRQAHRTTATFRPLLEAAREWRHQFAPGNHPNRLPRRDALITAIDNTLAAEDPPEPEQAAGRPGCSCRASGPDVWAGLRSRLGGDPGRAEPQPADRWAEARESWEPAWKDAEGALWRNSTSGTTDGYGAPFVICGGKDVCPREFAEEEYGPLQGFVLVPVEQLDDLIGEYAKTCSNFDEYADATAESAQQLRAGLSAAVAELDRLIRERDEAENQPPGAAGWAPTLALHLRLLVQAVEQWQRAPSGPQPVSPIYASRVVEQVAGQARGLLDLLDQLDQDPAAGRRKWANAGIATAMRHLTAFGRADLADQVRHLFADYHRQAEHVQQLRADLAAAQAALRPGIQAVDADDMVTAQTLYAGLPQVGAEPGVAEEA